MTPQPPQSMTSAIRTPAMGLAIRLCVQLQQQAKRHGAMPELAAEEDFAIRMLFEELGRHLADGDDALVAAKIPFHRGGTFGIDNLELVLDPEPTDLAARRNAGLPIFQVGDLVHIADHDCNRRIAEVFWNSEESDWNYGMDWLMDPAGNIDFDAQQCFSGGEILALRQTNPLPIS